MSYVLSACILFTTYKAILLLSFSVSYFDLMVNTIQNFEWASISNQMFNMKEVLDHEVPLLNIAFVS